MFLFSLSLVFLFVPSLSLSLFPQVLVSVRLCDLPILSPVLLFRFLLVFHSFFVSSVLPPIFALVSGLIFSSAPPCFCFSPPCFCFSPPLIFGPSSSVAEAFFWVLLESLFPVFFVQFSLFLGSFFGSFFVLLC
ncbi:hypothetical protein Peur_016744 [Populus x canadensis]